MSTTIGMPAAAPSAPVAASATNPSPSPHTVHSESTHSPQSPQSLSLARAVVPAAAAVAPSRGAAPGAPWHGRLHVHLECLDGATADERVGGLVGAVVALGDLRPLRVERVAAPGLLGRRRRVPVGLGGGAGAGAGAGADGGRAAAVTERVEPVVRPRRRRSLGAGRPTLRRDRERCQWCEQGPQGGVSGERALESALTSSDID